MPEGVLYHLSNRGFAVVDEDDLEEICRYEWYQHMGYARARTADGEVHMSHVVCPCPEGLEVDHINRNKLDNRKSNLRVVTRSENCANRGSFRNSSSQYKGVHWSKKTGRWEVSITKDGIQIYVGSFDDEITAASAYNDYARKLWGEFAVLNDIVEVDYRSMRHMRTSKHSKYLGVTKHARGKWIARLTIDGKRRTLGYFDSELEAAKAFNKAYVETKGKEAPNVIE